VTWRRLLLVVVAVATLAALAVAAGIALLSGDGEGASGAVTTAETGVREDEGEGGPERCGALADEPARACYAEELKALVDGADDPETALGEIAVAAYTAEDGFLLASCHGLMHTVGREYAIARGVTLGTLS
jgi:hypothetical protein